MRLPHDREPLPGWRTFLERQAAEIWARDFFCVQTLWFKTLYGFFVVSHASREVLHVQVTEHPTAEWVAQQIVECCGWDHEPPRFLNHAIVRVSWNDIGVVIFRSRSGTKRLADLH